MNKEEGAVPKEWWKTHEAAKYLGVHKFTVTDLIRRKKLSACKVGRTYRIRKDDCDKYLERTRVLARG